MRVLTVSRLVCPKTGLMHLVLLFPSDCPYCPNLTMFSKRNTSMVKSKGNII